MVRETEAIPPESFQGSLIYYLFKLPDYSQQNTRQHLPLPPDPSLVEVVSIWDPLSYLGHDLPTNKCEYDPSLFLFTHRHLPNSYFSFPLEIANLVEFHQGESAFLSEFFDPSLGVYLLSFPFLATLLDINTPDIKEVPHLLLLTPNWTSSIYSIVTLPLEKHYKYRRSFSSLLNLLHALHVDFYLRDISIISDKFFSFSGQNDNFLLFLINLLPLVSDSSLDLRVRLDEASNDVLEKIIEHFL